MKTKLLNATILLAALVSAMPSAPVYAAGGRGAHARGHAARPHHTARAHSRHRHHFHRHSHFGFFIGAPLVLAPWYAPPPAVVVPSAPTVYIEKDRSAAPGDDTQYWYYCRESETYYPYVKQCAGPWERMLPYTPPS